MSEYTIEITTYCPYKCSYCSTNTTNQDGQYLSIEAIKEFLEKQAITPLDKINISGGEPLAHPMFWDILQLCKSLTRDVVVYTNALTSIRYNASVVAEINCEANVCLVPGESVYIPKKAHVVHLLQLVPQGRTKGMQASNIKVSSNIGNVEACGKCNHKVLQANGVIVNAPCKKNYETQQTPD